MNDEKEEKAEIVEDQDKEVEPKEEVVETQSEVIVAGEASNENKEAKPEENAESDLDKVVVENKTVQKSQPIGDTKQKDKKAQESETEEEIPEFVEKIITIKRVTKVTKGGKKLSFSALAVVGNTKGRVGFSLGKGGEVAIAIRKALVRAKKNMINVPMSGTTITHEIIGVCGGAEVMLKPASEGTGVIAAGPVRAVCDGAGIHNILTKCHRSNNPINVVKATVDGLSRLKTKRV